MVASIFPLILIMASASLSSHANPATTTELPTKPAASIEPKQAHKSQGIDLIKLHSKRKTVDHPSSFRAPADGSVGIEKSEKEPPGRSDEREFLNGRPGNSFDLGGLFDPSHSGGFEDLRDFLKDSTHVGGSNEPSRNLFNPFLNAAQPTSSPRRNPTGSHINSNVIESGKKSNQRPPRDDVQLLNQVNNRPFSGVHLPGRASPFPATSDEFPRPFPVDGARGGNTGFHLSSSSRPSGSAQEDKNGHGFSSDSSESNPAVTKKNLPLELFGEVPSGAGEILEEQRALGNGHLGFSGHFDQGFPEAGNQYIDPSAAARYRLLQRYLLEDRLRTQGPAGITRRPAYGPDYYSQLDGFGYQQDPLQAPLDLPAAAPVPVPTSGLRPDLNPGYTELDERYPPRCTQFYDDVYGRYNRSYCLYDPDYPTLDIVEAIKRSPRSTYRLFSDVTYQSADDLVDGLTREQEEGYTFDYYVGQRQSSHFSHQGSSTANGYICPSHVAYARPKRAQNVRGLWKVIVNLADEQNVPYEYRRFTQTQRIEHCLHPERPCSFIASHLSSKCLQQHNYVRMVAHTPRDGLHVDSFRMPIACSCHLGQRRSFIGPHSSNAKSSSNSAELKYKKQ